MENEDDAQQMVDANAVNPPTIRQRNIYIQFSNHKELKTDNSPGQQVALLGLIILILFLSNICLLYINNSTYPYR